MSDHTDPAAIHETANHLEETYANLLCPEEGYPAAPMDEVNAAEQAFYAHIREHRDVLGTNEFWDSAYRNLDRHDLSKTPEGVRTWATRLQSEASELYASLSSPMEPATRTSIFQKAAAIDGELDFYVEQHREVFEQDPVWADRFAPSAPDLSR
ncbi:hypothetical protein ATM97_02850 [Nocardia sp. MH4]|uniref:hypothetical protein n=1 Tax=Nocardia sp. MH4 TaxID=1768677 RepID=UPI001C4F1313|nr:hypothetical protein [Nocardia sp. MH4]MBW0270059.1 hypothetical protein [Nocardia sp. MH4]